MVYIIHTVHIAYGIRQVPLYPFENDTTIINAVVEIPRWTDGKIEIESEEPLTPIFHDDRKGAPRFVESVWPHRSYPFVYGSVCFSGRLLPYRAF
jgi:inorganic pyrophosphatase